MLDELFEGLSLFWLPLLLLLLFDGILVVELFFVDVLLLELPLFSFVDELLFWLFVLFVGLFVVISSDAFESSSLIVE